MPAIAIARYSHASLFMFIQEVKRVAKYFQRKLDQQNQKYPQVVFIQLVTDVRHVCGGSGTG